MFSKVFLVASIINDIYDAYGLIPELQLFTDAVLSTELPEYMKSVYQALLETFKEMEHDLAVEGRSYCIYYAREEMKQMIKAYMQEAKWRHERVIPRYEEYKRVARVSFGYDLGVVISYLGMGEIATKEAFEWACQIPKSIEATGIIGRLLNDMGGHKFEQSRDHVASSVECYKNEYDVSDEKACDELLKQVEAAWKEVNEVMLHPHVQSKPLLDRSLNLTHLLDVIYKGEDGYTTVSQTIKDKITAMLVDPLPM